MIVIWIIDHSKPQTEIIPEQYWSPQITEEMVLCEAIEILEDISLVNSQDSLDYLHKMAIYQMYSDEYAIVRGKARETLLRIAEFKLRKPYQVQITLLQSIDKWLTEDFENNIFLCIPLITETLKMGFHGSRISPVKDHQLIIEQGTLQINNYLRQIRDKALKILFSSYEKANNLSSRLKIINGLNNRLPSHVDLKEMNEETLEYLHLNFHQVTEFYLEKVTDNTESPILEEIRKWVQYLKQVLNFKKFDPNNIEEFISDYQSEEIKHDNYYPKTLDILQEKLKKHKKYQLYCLLAGNYFWDEEDNYVK